MNLAIYLKEMWKKSTFCRLNWRAARTGLIPQVDLRIGIGCGEVALDDDVWSGSETLEGIFISEAKRIEGQADGASETLIMVKLDIMEACIQAGEKVEFGPRIRLQGKGMPAVHETAVYPVKTYAEWKAIQKKLMPSPRTYFQRFGHALALRRSGDLEGAIKQYGRLLKLRPDDPDVLNNRAAALYDLKRYQEALADYNHALQLRPDHPDTLYNRAYVLDDLGRYKEALADYSRALQLRPDDPATLNNRGVTLHHLKRYDEALADYNRSLQLRPDDPDTLSNRGVTLDSLKRDDEALADYNHALQIRPDDPDTLYNRGNTLRHLERYEEALADYNRSLQLRPDDPATLYNRAYLFSLTRR
ncbi:MAG: tetratricopeptide repeat protein, partial [Chloroflexota bacterium]|nr:tetratricopeptide repeat protein [Chloroflexota bacterium]